ncbi:MAG TPA: DUF2946 family protein [Candidimonas sp.]|nr:DUF2946 family protein [Candidimonas sp.]
MPLTVWRFMLWLTVAAFACRALVPTGFMPDTNALRNGQLVLTFCTVGGGTSILPLNLPDTPKSAADQDATNSIDCPFGLLAEQAMVAPSAMQVLVAAILRQVSPTLLFKALPPLPAHGPPLGSRAPPPSFG